MKTVLEQLMELNAKLAELEKAVIGTSTDEVECDGQCGCGCDESPVEVEDEGPEFDSAGFSEADRLEEEDGGGMRHCGDDYYSDESPVTPQQAQKIVFTKEELIIFAAKLMERTVDACKEAVDDIEFDSDYICDLSLSYNNYIEVEIENAAIQRAISDEIDNTIELDNDSVETEVDNILTEMLNEKNS